MLKNILVEKSKLFACLVVGFLVGGGALSAHAQALVYEGFNYDPATSFPSPNDGSLGGGTDGSFGWMQPDPVNPPFTDPLGNGWTTQQYLETGSSSANPSQELLAAGLTYTDSNGDQLLTSGGALDITDWDTAIARPTRYFDVTASGIGGTNPELLKPNGRLGGYGSTIWISFLGEGRADPGAGASNVLNFRGDDTNQIGTGRKTFAIGRPNGLKADGTRVVDGPNDSWGFFRHDDGTPNLEVALGPGAPGNPTTAEQKVFMVVKLDFLGPADQAFSGAGNYGTNVSAWINPDLSADLEANPTGPGSGINFANEVNVWEINFSMIQPGGNADAIFDEFRLGTSYADVAPIVSAGLDGDFDLDGDVDGFDFLKWQRDLGDSANLALWESNFGTAPAVSAAAAVPEPASAALAFAAALSIFGLRSRARRLA